MTRTSDTGIGAYDGFGLTGTTSIWNYEPSYGAPTTAPPGGTGPEHAAQWHAAQRWFVISYDMLSAPRHRLPPLTTPSTPPSNLRHPHRPPHRR